MDIKGITRKLRLFASVLIGLAALLSPAESLLAANEFRFDRLSLEHGLSQSSVFALAEDSSGFLWIATEQGLDRFDGFTVETLRYQPGSGRSLTHSGVRAVLVDHHGAMWVGTWNGLNRVDPSNLEVTQFAAAGPDEVPVSVRSEGLAQVCSNRLLAFGRDRLWWLNLDADAPSLHDLIGQPGDPSLVPHVWQATKDGSVWLANATILWRLNCELMRLEQIERLSLPTTADVGQGPSRLASLPDGRLLWASAEGLMVIDPLQKPLVPELLKPPSFWNGQPPLAVHVDQSSRVWVLLPNGMATTDSNDLSGWNAAAEWSAALAADINHRMESAVSGDGLTWLAGTFGLGVVEESEQRLRLLEHDPTRPDSLPPTLARVGYRILADRFGVLWVGANLGGLARYVPEQHRFSRLPLLQQGSSRVVRGVAEVQNGDWTWLWVGYDDAGVEVLELDARGRFAPVARFGSRELTDTALPNDKTVALLPEPNRDAVWILGPDWLLRHDAAPQEGPFRKPSVPSEFRSARAMAFSRDHRYLFVTTASDLWRLSLDMVDGKLERVELDLPLNEIWDFYPVLELEDGTLAVGCRKGLHLVDPGSGRIRTLTLGVEQAGSPARFVFSLAEASNGDLWLGTHGGGVIRIAAEDLALEDPPLQRWSTAEGLADNTVYAILEDGEACLWLTGNRGLSQFCPEQNRLRNFSLHDGLQAYEFNGRVADVGPSGQFYFGGINGVNSFRPERIVDHPLPPAIRLTGLSVSGQVLEASEWQQALRLRHDQNDLTIDYLGLHSTAPNRIRYAHRLLGLESRWVEAGDTRRVRFPALPPGDYRFELRAANPDGVWSEPEVLFEATIRPPYWRTGPAYLGYALLLLVALTMLVWTVRQRRRQLEALVSQRTRQLAERNETVSRQADELESLLQSRQTLYANVSHELRTPMTLIQAGLARLKSNPQDTEALALSERYIQRLDRLVDQLLDLSRVRADAFSTEAQPWALADWLRGVARDHTALAEQRQLHLDLVLQGQWRTRCNRELLEKCLTNLLSNALKYTPAGGQIVLRLGGSAEQAEIEVADTGPGIPPDQQAIIFERFQRLPAHENQSEKGAGIGLALVHEAALALGGKVHLHSRPGEGSRFILVLPADQIGAGIDASGSGLAPEASKRVEGSATVPQLENQPQVPAPAQVKRLGTLLVVEDNPDLRGHLKRMLSDQWGVITARDGDQALVRLDAHDVDIILSDIMMPGMDGLDLLRHIRDNLATSHIPFLVLTARRDAATRLQGLRLAADIILTKPFSDEELRLRLANIYCSIERRLQHQSRQQDGSLELSPRDQALTARINAWMEANYGNSDMRIGDLANHLAMDERSLQRKLRALLGQTPKALLTQYRLDRAADMLRDGNRRIAEIATECGFPSASHFSRSFAQRFGSTPRAWREGNSPRE